MDTNSLKTSSCKIVIFDLDDTLRPKKEIVHKREKLSNHVLDILLFFRMHGFKLTLASLHMYADYHLKLYGVLPLFDIVEKRTKFFDFDKTAMFKNILHTFSVQPHNVILFDDRFSHCFEAASLGIKYVHVNGNFGITWKDVKQGLSLFNRSVVKRRNSI